MAAADRYLAPDWFTPHVFNPFVTWLTNRAIAPNHPAFRIEQEES